MTFPIGFATTHNSGKIEIEPFSPQRVVPVKSLVEVYFPGCNQTLTYFNDRFDLKQGDLVFVDGKLEAVRGIVREVNKNFKIKVSDYKRIVSVADTNVSGRFHMAGSHFVCFDASVLPYEKVRTWFLPPVKEEDAYETGNDDTAFTLENLSDMGMSRAIFERGREYYLKSRVAYLCIDNGHGRAIVEGKQAYEVEFHYAAGAVRSLTCTCPYSQTCKHEVATMLQLKETMEMIESNYANLCNGYFAAVAKADLFQFVIDCKKSGSFTL